MVYPAQANLMCLYLIFVCNIVRDKFLSHKDFQRELVFRREIDSSLMIELLTLIIRYFGIGLKFYVVVPIGCAKTG